MCCKFGARNYTFFSFLFFLDERKREGRRRRRNFAKKRERSKSMVRIAEFIDTGVRCFYGSINLLTECTPRSSGVRSFFYSKNLSIRRPPFPRFHVDRNSVKI